MLACHAGGPGSIPGRCKVFDSRLSDKISFEPRYSTTDETLTSKTQAINVYIPNVQINALGPPNTLVPSFAGGFP